jgi:hypothetical protein
MSSALVAALLAAGMRLVASHAVADRPAGPVGYAEGSPPGFSGGFREDNCTACHFHETLNAPAGKLTVEGVPATFAPGERYTLTVTLTRDGIKRAGFQLAVRFKDGAAQAGTLAPGAAEAERVKVETSGGIQYAGQQLAGSVMRDAGMAKWIVEWTAPADVRAVIVHVAANAANGDERVDGDFVYTTSFETARPEAGRK